MNELRVCKKCGIEKDIMDFRHQVRGEKVSIMNTCKKCANIPRQIKRESKKIKKPQPKEGYKFCSKCHLEKELVAFGKYRQSGKLLYKAACYECNKPSRQKYYINHTIRIIAHNSEYKKQNRTQVNEREKNRRQNDPVFKLHESIRSIVKMTIKRNGGSKGGKSVIKYLEYSFEQLKEHFENLFEPWMTWQNWGVYNSQTWNDEDQSTWTWQMDHIVPSSDLPYISMNDNNFKVCWMLNNLRPYSAKQNVIDGVLKIRHRRAKLL